MHAGTENNTTTATVFDFELFWLFWRLQHHFVSILDLAGYVAQEHNHKYYQNMQMELFK